MVLGWCTSGVQKQQTNPLLLLPISSWHSNILPHFMYFIILQRSGVCSELLYIMTSKGDHFKIMNCRVCFGKSDRARAPHLLPSCSISHVDVSKQLYLWSIYTTEVQALGHDKTCSYIHVCQNQKWSPWFQIVSATPTYWLPLIIHMPLCFPRWTWMSPMYYGELVHHVNPCPLLVTEAFPLWDVGM